MTRPADPGHKYRLGFLLRDLGEGGAERSSLRLANGLAGDGMPVTLFLMRKKGPMLAEVAPGVRVVDFSHLRSAEIDYLMPVYTSMSALLAKILLRARWQVILSQRNMFTMDRGPIQTRLRFLRCRLLYPFASACVCISRGVADEMRTLGLMDEKKIRVIYNSAITDRLLTDMEEPASHPWFEDGARPVILGAGRLGDQKDFSTMIRAFALLRHKPAPRLVIFGEGKERPKLEKLVRELGLEDRVSLPGYVSNPYPYMKRAAVTAVTSRFEGFCLVVAEALACGCTVASTDCKSGPGEILDGGRYGYLARVGDAEDMARAMEQALSHPLPPEELKERALVFSDRRAVEEYKKLFRELDRGE
jgi:glycosyltransferase involved in cell wall biosynthesis